MIYRKKLWDVDLSFHERLSVNNIIKLTDGTRIEDVISKGAKKDRYWMTIRNV